MGLGPLPVWRSARIMQKNMSRCFLCRPRATWPVPASSQSSYAKRCRKKEMPRHWCVQVCRKEDALLYWVPEEATGSGVWRRALNPADTGKPLHFQFSSNTTPSCSRTGASSSRTWYPVGHDEIAGRLTNDFQRDGTQMRLAFLDSQRIRTNNHKVGGNLVAIANDA